MIPQAIAIINGKGGVLKTTVAANLAGGLAAAGYRVLLLELDPQGNTLRDLGLYDSPANDQGARLTAALAGQAKLEVHEGARERLDLAAGGDTLDDFEASPGDVDAMLEPLADTYDLIVLDCPPGNRRMQVAALTAARFAVIPTKADDGSIDGLRRIARLFAEVRGGGNPDLELLGVVLTDVGTQSRAIMRETREGITALFGDEDAMFLTVIRHAFAPARDARKMGKLAHELDRDLYASLGELIGPRRFAASAPGLAGDHQRLAAEIAQRISDRVSS